MEENKELERVEIPEEEKECVVDWTNSYNECNKELVAQQSKRDQIIAFYVAVAGFIVPIIYELNLHYLAQSAAFLLLVIIGWFLSKVVVRYRLYKESYWITSRTISQFFLKTDGKVVKRTIQDKFKQNLLKGEKSVIVRKKTPTGERFEDQVDWWKTTKKVNNSAETILYKIIVLMTAVTVFLTVFTSANPLLGLIEGISGTPSTLIAVAVSLLAALATYSHLTFFYVRSLASIYKYCITKKDEDFNGAFDKAWFLHFYA